jgi:predicted nucleic acid-binding protein
VILIDTNIFMYAAGAKHRNRGSSVRLVKQISNDEADVAIDAEVLQEILHRYRAIGRWQDGVRVYDLVRKIVPAVIAIRAEHLDLARDLLDDNSRLTARDALHAAVCYDTGARGICSFDRHFDSLEGMVRYEPAELLASG